MKLSQMLIKEILSGSLRDNKITFYKKYTELRSQYASKVRRICNPYGYIFEDFMYFEIFNPKRHVYLPPEIKNKSIAILLRTKTTRFNTNFYINLDTFELSDKGWR